MYVLFPLNQQPAPKYRLTTRARHHFLVSLEHLLKQVTLSSESQPAFLIGKISLFTPMHP